MTGTGQTHRNNSYRRHSTISTAMPAYSLNTFFKILIDLCNYKYLISINCEFKNTP